MACIKTLSWNLVEMFEERYKLVPTSGDTPEHKLQALPPETLQ